MDEIDKLLQRIEALTTADYFPAIYEGFAEAEALEQGEDALLGIMSSYVLELWQNRNLLSMDEEKTALFEKQLHIVPTPSQSLDDRRAAVADAINELFVLNDATLHEICQSLAPDFTVYEKTDPQELTLGVFTEEDDDQGHLPAVGIVNEIRPTVPQNLALYAGVDTSFERPLVVSHAHFSALWAGLGVVEWHEPPEPPEPIAPKGYIVVDSGGSIQHSVDLGDMFIHQIQHSVEVVNFYFTANGAVETEDSELESGVDVTLYNADGTVADDALYDGSGTLTYTQANGNMFEAADGGDLISLQSGALVVNPNTDYAALSVQLEKVGDIVLKVAWGDTVNVPAGYEAYEVRTFVGYAFKSYYGIFTPYEDKIVAWPGKDDYFDNIPNHYMLAYSLYSDDPDYLWPLVEVFQATGPHLVGKYLTVGWRNQSSEWVTQDRYTNGTDAVAGDYSVYLRGNNTTDIVNALTIGYPVRYLWFDCDDQGNESWAKSPEAFRLPHSLWSFQNGTFSWLGNSEDMSDLAWWYKHDWELFQWEGFDGVWFYVHCRKVNS